MEESYAVYKIWNGCKVPNNLEYNGKLCGHIVGCMEDINKDSLLRIAKKFDMESDLISRHIEASEGCFDDSDISEYNTDVAIAKIIRNIAMEKE